MLFGALFELVKEEAEDKVLLRAERERVERASWAGGGPELGPWGLREGGMLEVAKVVGGGLGAR